MEVINESFRDFVEHYLQDTAVVTPEVATVILDKLATLESPYVGLQEAIAFTRRQSESQRAFFMRNHADDNHGVIELLSSVELSPQEIATVLNALAGTDVSAVTHTDEGKDILKWIS